MSANHHRSPNSGRLRLVMTVVSAALVLALSSSASAENETAFFEKQVRPILVASCYECHSEEAGKRKGGLWLDRKAGWQMGGDSGPALVPGDTDQSLLLNGLWTMISSLKSNGLEEAMQAFMEKRPPVWMEKEQKVTHS